MEKLLEILNDTCPGIDFDTETSLCDDGLLTSFDIVAIVSELMMEYDIEIDVDDLTPENFNSAQSIWELINKYEG